MIFTEPDSTLARLLEKCIPLGPHDRALVLEGSKEVEAAHAHAASQGTSRLPGPENPEQHAYITLVKSDKTNKLYEMDGGKKGPLYKDIVLGENEDVLSKKVMRVVKEYIEREEGAVDFSVIALVSE